ncbi:hypothetical protein JMJ35_004633 [Cladonia borealis]|uniref:Uncharacterized protein n=1 Tax=Cladonia borealis TaxID=184061 RepID=A0AA39R382_9LECA|nr:hypothetical protein JMJ35_004633 [Cladonia borealis]
MARTKTSHLPELTRAAPDSVTFTFPKHSENLNGHSSDTPSTIVTIPPGSSFTTSLHWHVTHTEYIRVISGAALITLSNQTKVYTAEDGIAVIPRYARHEWMRFDRPAHLLSKSQRKGQEKWMEEHGEDVIEKLRGMDLVAEEWTDPGDGEKEVFFRNILSTLKESQWREGWWGVVLMLLQIMLVMWELDNPVVLLDLGGPGDGDGWRGAVETAVTYAFMWSVAMMGKALGLKAVNEEYTPKYLLKAWDEGKAKGKRE